MKQEAKLKKRKIQEKIQKKKENTEEKIEEENPVSEESKVSEENKEEIKTKIPIQSRNSYLRIPGPGTRASSGCLETPCWKQKFGEKSSSDSGLSSGTIKNFTVIHGSSREGNLSGPKKLDFLLSKQILGSDARSCSTATTYHSTVLAGRNISNCTLGGKTTDGRYLRYSMDKDTSLSGQLGQYFGPTRTSQGNYNTEHHQIKSPEARKSDRSA